MDFSLILIAPRLGESNLINVRQRPRRRSKKRWTRGAIIFGSIYGVCRQRLICVRCVPLTEVYREAIGTVGMAGLAGRGRAGLNRGAGLHESPAAAGKRAAADRL